MAKHRHIIMKFKVRFLNAWKDNIVLRDRVSKYKFVDKCTDISISFVDDVELYQVNLVLDLLAQYGLTLNTYSLTGLKSEHMKNLEKTFLERLRDKSFYTNLDFGPDVSEDEKDLDKYFLRTKLYYSVLEGNIKLVVGPKGSGKSAIKKMVYDNNPEHCILITPEHYAVDILNEIQRRADFGPKEQAFATAWKYTLLVEVLRKLFEAKKILKTGPYSVIHRFLRDNHEMVDLDVLTRFVRYLKKIEGVKLSDKEISFKTKELVSLYSLEALYQILPSLKKVLKNPFYILIDELDQGWDNSENSNNFIIGLFLAANELNSYHEMLHCCVFIRGEIFDLACKNYGQVDKLRHITEIITWNKGSLLEIVCRRMAFSLGMFVPEKPSTIVENIFDRRDFMRKLGEPPSNYIIDRTSMRPRDLIYLLRLAHDESVEKKHVCIDSDSLQVAEGKFSKHKYEHLCSEYISIYPELQLILESFRFKKRILSYDELELLCIENILNSYETGRPIWLKELEPEHLIQILYHIEFIGIPSSSREGFHGYCYSFNKPNIYVRNSREFHINPAFWKYLNLNI